MIQQNPNSRPNQIGDVKNELIAQKNLFIAAQKLDEKSKEVVPVCTPEKVEAVRLIDVEYQKRTLILKLNRVPEPGWIQRFHSPKGNYRYLPGKEPDRFGFNDNMSTISADEHDAQALVNHFKEYCEMTTRDYQADLREEAREKEAMRRENLELEAKDAEISLNIRKNLEF